MTSPIDENLLTGAMALQWGLVNGADFAAAVSTWSAERRRPLVDILRQRGALDDETRAALTALVVKMTTSPQCPSVAEILARAPGGLDALESIRDLGDIRLNDTLALADAYQTRPLKEKQPLGTPDGASAVLVESTHERFKAIQLHAQGGLGEVWTAEDADLKRQVALKEIRRKHADLPQSRARFVQEAEITGRLEHPGIVPVYAMGRHADGRPYYVMRFIRGDSLQQAIERYHASRRTKGGATASPDEASAPTLRQLLARFIAMCEAVAYAHSRGVLHRDLKPDNVMLGSYGETLVVDWGLAKADGHATVVDEQRRQTESMVLVENETPTLQGSALGTPGYMSPEQAGGDVDKLTPATDVYSLGATLYCLLTGQPPIRAKSVKETLDRTVAGDVPLPRSVCADAPRPLQSICMRALAWKPNQRYASARALADDVQSFLDDEPVAAHADSLTERATRWVRRHRSGVLAGGAALALVAVVASAAAALIAQSRNEALHLADEKARLADSEQRSRQQAQRRQLEAEEAGELARAQRARAEKYYELAIGNVDDFLTNVSEDARLKAVGLETLRRDLLVRARDFYELVIEQATAGEDPLHTQRANAQKRLGDISFEIGDYGAAIQAYRQSSEHYLVLGEEADAGAHATVVNALAMAYGMAGQQEQAAQIWRPLIDDVERLTEAEPQNAIYHDLHAIVCLNLALYETERDPEESLELLSLAERSCDVAMELAPDDADFRETLALVRNNRGNTLISRERYDEASTELAAAESIWRALRAHAKGGSADELDDRLAMLCLNKAVIAANLANDDEAVQLLQQGIELRQRIADQHPDAAQLQSRLAELRVTAAMHYRSLVRYESALQETNAAVTAFERLAERFPEVPSYRQLVASAWLEHGLTYLTLGKIDQSLDSVRKAIVESSKLVEQELSSTAERAPSDGGGASDQASREQRRAGYRRTRALARYWLGLVLMDAAQPSDAAEALRQAADELEQIKESLPYDADLRVALADCHDSLGTLYGRQLLDDPLQADRWLRKSRGATEQLLSEPWASRIAPSEKIEAIKIRAKANSQLKLYDEALQDWETVLQMLGSQRDFEVDMGKAETLYSLGKLEQALDLVQSGVDAQDHPALAYAAAREVALGVQGLSELALTNTQRAHWQETYGAAAVALLERAAAGGYFEASEAAAFLPDDPYLAPIRERSDFHEFLENLSSTR